MERTAEFENTELCATNSGPAIALREAKAATLARQRHTDATRHDESEVPLCATSFVSF